MMYRWIAVHGCALAALALATSQALSAQILFQKPHAWTKDVSALETSPRSDAMIETLANSGGWGGGNRLRIDFSISLLNADATTPRRTIAPLAEGYCFDTGIDCDPLPLEMPIPAGGNIEGSDSYACDTEENDCHLLVHDRASHKLYELYRATGDENAITAYGAFVWDLTRQYGETLRGEQCTSADAAGLPISALLATADEVAAGEVAHAVRFILPNDRMKAQAYVHPATHAGGPSNTEENAPPYGVRFRLKADFDVSSYDANAQVILRALKTYGMILSDGGQIALTFADDRYSQAKWADLGIATDTFDAIPVSAFEAVDLGPELALTYDCKRTAE